MAPFYSHSCIVQIICLWLQFCSFCNANYKSQLQSRAELKQKSPCDLLSRGLGSAAPADMFDFLGPVTRSGQVSQPCVAYKLA